MEPADDPTRVTCSTTLTEEQTRLLLGKNLGALATVRPDGVPHVTPVWLDWDGENVVFNTKIGRAKERHMRRDPRVTIQVFPMENPYQYVSISGIAEFADEGADEHIDNLTKRYLGLDTYPYRKPDERRVIVKVHPQRVLSVGFDMPR